MKIGLISNNEPDYQRIAKKIIKILKKHKMDFEIYNKIRKAKCDILIVVGGDGTIFKATKEYPNAMLLPIKRLKPRSSISKILEKIKKGEHNVEKFMRLEVIFKGLKRWGINDIVVFRDDENANRFRIYSDGKDIYGDEIIGDGVVVATPYGSTGYNWAAGGPVLKENEKKFVVTPICSSYFNKKLIAKNRFVKKKIERSKIIPDNKEIVIKFFRNLKNKIIPDGRNEERVYANIKTGDKLLIRKSNRYSKFIKF